MAVRASAPAIERFWRYVDKSGECWVWTGTTSGSHARYGYFRSTTRSSDKRSPAHRWLYEYTFGPQDGLEIDHICRNPLCVRLEHLEAVTPRENMRRTRRTVCRKGLHDLTDPANMRWDDQGRRRGCAECKRVRNRKGW